MSCTSNHASLKCTHVTQEVSYAIVRRRKRGEDQRTCRDRKPKESAMPTHGQSRLMSLVEAVVNTVVGMGVAMVATAVICKVYDIPMTLENNFIITFWMTVLSVLRSYLLRRLFNADWRPRLQAWWIVRRPAVVQFIGRMTDAHAKFRSGDFDE